MGRVVQRTGQQIGGSKLCWVRAGTCGAEHRAVEWDELIGLGGGRDGWCSAPGNRVRGANWVGRGKGRVVQSTGEQSGGSKFYWVGEGTVGAAHRAAEWWHQIGLGGEGTVFAAHRATNWGQQIVLGEGRDVWCRAPGSRVG